MLRLQVNSINLEKSYLDDDTLAAEVEPPNTFKTAVLCSANFW